MSDVHGYMLGPKGENIDAFRRLLLETLDDHIYWRRNFHPADRPFITSGDQRSDGYHDFSDRLRDHLLEFLADAKAGIPFFSARHLGHMHTDLLMPAVLGYFAFMLYNQNNVAPESSPVSNRMERETIEILARMAGYNPERAFGYLSSGGTASNLQSLWVARNLRSFPLALRAAAGAELTPVLTGSILAESNSAASASPSFALHALRDSQAVLKQRLRVRTATGKEMALAEMDAWELANLPVEEVWGLRTRLDEMWTEYLAPDQRRLANALLCAFEIRTLGASRFCAVLDDTFRGEYPFWRNPWQIVVPGNKHYSWTKIADILGFGWESIYKTPLQRGFETDVNALREKLDHWAQERQTWPLMLVSNFGATEEGSLDNLAEIHRVLREKAAGTGLSVWWHVDAAYGGYLASMIRGNLDAGAVAEPEALKAWLAACADEIAVPSDAARKLIEISEHSADAAGWLPWHDFIRRTAALAHADSITIDPHKLGYIPYPAGALLMRDKDVTKFISHDAPYLWANTKDEDSLLGRYTLEGSRPGAAAAGCWLAHRTIPLDQTGHGKIVGLSILGARRLYDALDRRFRNCAPGPLVLLAYQPHSNILCYVPYHQDCKSLADVSALAARVLRRLDPVNGERNFIAVGTTLEVTAAEYPLENAGTHALLARMIQDELAKGREHVSLPVIRTVVMGMFHLKAETKNRTGETENTLEAYAAELERILRVEAAGMLVDEANARADRWNRDASLVVVDDDPTVPQNLQDLMVELKHPKIADGWHYYADREGAASRIKDVGKTLDMAFLDIDLGGSGGEDAGYVLFNEILNRNRRLPDSRFRVKTVVFFSKNNLDMERVDALQRGSGTSVTVVSIDKYALDARSARRRDERLAAVRSIIREIAALPIEEKS